MIKGLKMPKSEITSEALSEAEGIGWTVAAAVGDAIDFTAFIVVAKTVREIVASVGGIKNMDLPINPNFCLNSMSMGPTSPHTVKYLRTRSYKKMGGSIIAGSGALAAQATQFDPSGGIATLERTRFHFGPFKNAAYDC